MRGADRTGRAAVVSRINIALGQPVGFLDIQRAIEALYATGQYEDVNVLQGTIDGRQILRFEVVERTMLGRWDVEGTSRIPERSVRGKVRLLSGRPFNPADLTTAIAAIDSLYEKEGYYQTSVETVVLPQADGRVNVLFNVKEGSRVAVSRVIIEGNEAFKASEIVSHMSTRPEGFFWFKKGEYGRTGIVAGRARKASGVLRLSRVPRFSRCRVTRWSVNEETGKGTLILAVDEGTKYDIGTFEIIGNREFTAEQLEMFYPFTDGEGGGGFLGFGGGGRRQHLRSGAVEARNRRGGQPLLRQRLHSSAGAGHDDASHHCRRFARRRSALANRRGSPGDRASGADHRQHDHA